MLRIVVVMLAVAVLGACGGGSQKGERTVIDEEDQRRAEAALLRLSDFPEGWTAVPAEEGETEGDPECLDELEPDLSDLTVTGNAESDDFTYEAEAVQAGSSVSVYETEEQAQAVVERVFEVIGTDELVDCFADSIEEMSDAENAGVQFGALSGSEIPFPAVAEQNEAFELELPFEVDGQTASAFIDFVGVREERAAALLIFYGFLSPFPPEEQERLAQTVADRLEP